MCDTLFADNKEHVENIRKNFQDMKDVSSKVEPNGECILQIKLYLANANTVPQGPSLQERCQNQHL
jgi:hypothetical protein